MGVRPSIHAADRGLPQLISNIQLRTLPGDLVVKTIDQRIEALKTVTDVDSEIEAMLRFDEELLEKIEQLVRDPEFALPRAGRSPHHRK